MIKVCLISPTYPSMNCGVGDYAAELVRFLKEREVEVGILTSVHDKIIRFAKEETSINVKIFPVVKCWSLRRIGAIIKTIKDFKPDVIHLQYHWWITNDGFLIKGIMIVLLPLLIKFLNIKAPFLTTLHSRLGGPYLFPKAGKFRRWALLPLLLFSDKIIVTNKYDAKSITKWMPFLKNKIEFHLGGTGHYYKNDISQEEVIEAKEKCKKKEKEFIISNFGFVIPHKGFEELLNAMSLLAKKGYSLRLISIGGFDLEKSYAGSYLERLRKLAQELNLTDCINWMGFCQSREASLYLLASDACVMPFPDGASEWRSSFLDILSHGIPVISTCTEKTPEEFIDGLNCKLVPPKDSQRLAQAIEELISKPDLRKSIAEAGKELYKSQYDWQVIAEKTLATYEKCLNKTGIGAAN